MKCEPCRREFLKGAVAAVATVPVIGRTDGAESKRMRGATRPNILFCLADDASYPFMSAYGCSWVRTPGFDRVAREGLLFERAYTPNAKCAPSRACILTGRNSWQLEAAANHLCYFPEKFGTFMEGLEANGYFVGYTGKGWAPGDPGKRNGKRRMLTGRSFSAHRTQPPTRGISPIDYAANFEAFLAARPPGRPFCFWYGGREPHRGYAYGSGIRKGGKRCSDIASVPAFWPDNERVRTDLLDYAFEVEYFDRHVVRMLEALERAGELDNTLVVVTADNGMPFPRCKGQAYDYSNHLPLAIRWGAGIRNPGRRIRDFVSFIDFAPTFLEAAGIDTAAAGMQPITGRSLFEIFRSEKDGQVVPVRDHVLIGKERHDVGRPHDVGYPIRGIVEGDFLYLRNYKPSRWPAGNPETGYMNCDGSPTKTEILEGRRKGLPGGLERWKQSFGKRPAEELYRIDRDRECLVNLATDPEYAVVKRRLAKRMEEALKRQGDPRMFGKGDVFDAYPVASARHRGYYEKFVEGKAGRVGCTLRSDRDPDLRDPTPER